MLTKKIHILTSVYSIIFVKILTSLYNYINEEMLLKDHKQLLGNEATGIDDRGELSLDEEFSFLFCLITHH